MIFPLLLCTLVAQPDDVSEGVALLNEQQYEEAVEFFSERTNAGGFRVWYQLGVASRKAGDLPGALHALERASALRPSDVSPYVEIARVYIASNDYYHAVEYGLQGLKTPEGLNYWLLYDLGRSYRHMREFAKAERALRAAIALRPDEDKPYNLLGLIFLETRTYRLAAAAFSAAIVRSPGSAVYYNNRGVVYERCGDPDSLRKAGRDYRRALELNAEYANAAANLARVEEALREEREQTAGHETGASDEVSPVGANGGPAAEAE